MAQRQRKPARLLYCHATRYVARAVVVVDLRRPRVGRSLRSSFANPILRKLSRYPTDLNLQSTSNFALLTDYWRVIIQPDIVEEHLEKNIRNANQIVVFLRLVKWILRLAWNFVLKIFSSRLLHFSQNQICNNNNNV